MPRCDYKIVTVCQPRRSVRGSRSSFQNVRTSKFSEAFEPPGRFRAMYSTVLYLRCTISSSPQGQEALTSLLCPVIAPASVPRKPPSPDTLYTIPVSKGEQADDHHLGEVRSLFHHLPMALREITTYSPAQSSRVRYVVWPPHRLWHPILKGRQHHDDEWYERASLLQGPEYRDRGRSWNHSTRFGSYLLLRPKLPPMTLRSNRSETSQSLAHFTKHALLFLICLLLFSALEVFS
jgi:hypothetical protein